MTKSTPLMNTWVYVPCYCVYCSIFELKGVSLMRLSSTERQKVASSLQFNMYDQ